MFMENSQRESQENQNHFLEGLLTRLVPGGLPAHVAGVSLGQFFLKMGVVEPWSEPDSIHRSIQHVKEHRSNHLALVA